MTYFYHLFIFNMKCKRLLVLLLLVVSTTQAAFLCSALCLPNGCSGALETQCTSCPSDWTFGSNTCSHDPSSGYQLAGKSLDMIGGSSSITILPSTSTVLCAGSTYYGTHACNKNLSISMAISLAHYEIQVIFWVVFADDKTWNGVDNIYITLGSNQVSRIMSTFDGQATCSGKLASYYRIIATFPHVNTTGAIFNVDISNNASGGSCKWGFKESIVLTKVCHSYCT